MTETHTPGPWKAKGLDIGAANDVAIAKVYYNQESGRANARVIESAPSVLEALIDLVAVIEGVASEDEQVIALLYACKAISQATGEKS